MNVAEFVAATPLIEAPKGFEWPGKPYAKVVAFHFLPPENWGQFSLGDDATVINEGRLNATARESAALTTGQTTRLLQYVFKPKIGNGPSACYDPEHVFVFYSANNHPVAALEVCFSCKTIRCWPDKAGDPFHDFADMAKLASELHVWAPSAGTIDEYIKDLEFIADTN